MNSKNLALAAIALADFVAAVDTTGVNIAIPQIARHLHISALMAQWIPNAYALAMVSLLILAGKVGDRYGHRKLYLWGLAIFGLGSVGCGVSTSFPELVLFRLIQGGGGAILYTCGWALIAHLWDERETAFAVTAGFFAFGVVAGPPLAGWLTGLSLCGLAGWHLVFLINVPVIVVASILACRFTPPVPRDPSARAGVVSALLLMLDLILLVHVLSHSSDYLAWGCVGLLSLAFWLMERSRPARLIDAQLFQNQTFKAANATSLLLMALISGFAFVATFYLQNKLGFSSLSAGLAMLPIPAVMVAFAAIGSRIRQWRQGAVASGILALAAVVWLVAIGGGYWSGIFVSFVLLGAAGGLLMTSVVSAVMGSAPSEKAGAASGILNTLQQLGTLVGVATVAGLVTNVRMAIMLLIIPALGATLAALCIETRHPSADRFGVRVEEDACSSGPGGDL